MPRLTHRRGELDYPQWHAKETLLCALYILCGKNPMHRHVKIAGRLSLRPAATAFEHLEYIPDCVAETKFWRRRMQPLNGAPTRPITISITAASRGTMR